MDFLDTLAAKAQLDEETKRFIKFTWFGDLACSSGLHYVAGQRKGFEQIMVEIERAHSDDLVENLACWAMKEDLPTEISLDSLYGLCHRFYGLIKEHYEQNQERYSPDYPQLFAARNLNDYYRVIIKHSNCGGAMRSGLLGYGGVNDQDHFALIAMTHLNHEAVSGAYAVLYAVRAAREGSSPWTIRSQALVGAREGGAIAREFIERCAGEVPPGDSIEERMRKVFDTEDPCWGVDDMREEGIETRFVIPAALYLALQACELPPASALRYMVEQAIEIGGDPDTIGSIGMGVLGAHFREPLAEEIDAVLSTIVLDPSFVPPFLLA